MISFPPCPECEGSGKDPKKYCQQSDCHCNESDVCPKCGGLGVEISDELREEAAEQIDTKIYLCSPSCGYRGEGQVCENHMVQARRAADAVLAAVVAHLKGNQ